MLQGEGRVVVVAEEEEGDEEEEAACVATFTARRAGAAQGGGRHDSLALLEQIGEGGLIGSMAAYELKNASLLEVYGRVVEHATDVDAVVVVDTANVDVDAEAEDAVAGQVNWAEACDLGLLDCGEEEERDVDAEVQADVDALSHDHAAFRSDMVEWLSSSSRL